MRNSFARGPASGASPTQRSGASDPSGYSIPGSVLQNPRVLKIPFSDVPDETSQQTGKLYVAEGLYLSLNPNSSPDAVLMVGIDDAGSIIRLSRGQAIMSPSGIPYHQIYLLRPSSVPSDANKFYLLDTYWNPQQVSNGAVANATIATGLPGAPSHAGNQVLQGGAALQIVPLRLQRRGVLVRNINVTAGTVVYVGGAGVTTATGYPLLPYDSVSIDSTAPVYGITTGAAQTVAFIESYD